MKLNIALGIAAAVGVVLFFRSSKGKALLNEWGVDFDDLYSQGEEAVKNAVKKAEGYSRNAKETVEQAYNG